ncbi:MAG: VOC family protein [Longimicrobiales bacterium]|nr:VOC family protein [Longimicrobiales bacterium]
MSHPFVPRVGGVLSADIAVPDHARAVQFYSRVLSTGAEPLWREDTLMSSLGMPIIGLGARTPELEHLPVQWMPHIQVADVSESVSRAVEGGGVELVHARGEDGSSQWAVLLDPDGAAFGLIPVVPAGSGDAAEAGARPVGRIAWLDLTVADAPATRDFYGRVVGWSIQEVAMESDGRSYADFNMLGGDGAPAAGVCHARGVNRDLPPVWLLYLPVGDLAESLRRVKSEGGRIVRVDPGVGGEPALAVIQDPAGAYVALARQ